MLRTEFVNGNEVKASLDAINSRSRHALLDGITRLTAILQAKVVQEKLSGQMLRVRTGLLRRSIGRLVEESPQQVVGVVSTPVKYAAFHEYGFSGTITVREHMRRAVTSFRTVKVASAYDIGNHSKVAAFRIGRKASSVAITKGTVREHTRKVDYPAHSFLRTALAELDAAGTIKVEIDKSVEQALK